jgi:hypothetical protein
MSARSKAIVLGLMMVGLLAGTAWAKVDPSGNTAWMGVYTESINYKNAESSDLPVDYGALVTEVVTDSPADKAGLKENDIIIAFQGNKITDSDELSDAVAKAHAGDNIDLKIYRDGKPMNLSITLGAASESETEERVESPSQRRGYNFWYGRTAKQSYIGVNLSDLTDQLREFFGVAGKEGVLISSVAKDSPADHAGLKAGDILIAIDGRKVSTSSQVQNIVHDLKVGDKANLTVVRNKNDMRLPVEIAERDVSNALAELYGQAVPEAPEAPEVPEEPNVRVPRPRMNLYDQGQAEKYFNSEEFQKQLDELREQMKSFRMEVFNSEEFQKQMQQLKEELKKLDLNVKDLEKKVK